MKVHRKKSKSHFGKNINKHSEKILYGIGVQWAKRNSAESGKVVTNCGDGKNIKFQEKSYKMLWVNASIRIYKCV